jgi:hypothetical protein
MHEAQNRLVVVREGNGWAAASRWVINLSSLWDLLHGYVGTYLIDWLVS